MLLGASVFICCGNRNCGIELLLNFIAGIDADGIDTAAAVALVWCEAGSSLGAVGKTGANAGRAAKRTVESDRTEASELDRNDVVPGVRAFIEPPTNGWLSVSRV